MRQLTSIAAAALLLTATGIGSVAATEESAVEGGAEQAANVAYEAVNTASAMVKAAAPPAAGRAEKRVHEGTNRTYLVWSLAQLRNEPVTTNDMQLGAIRIGSDAATLLRAFGTPKEVRCGNMDTEYRFADGVAVVREAPAWPSAVAAQYGIDTAKLQRGVVAVASTAHTPATPRGLTVGNSRENVIRLYGAPSQVRWEPSEETTYYLYDNPEGTQRLTVKIHALQVAELRLDRLSGQNTPDMQQAPLQLMGLGIGELYREPTWATWESKAEVGTRCYWLFRDMMVEVDQPTQKIRKVIVRSPHVATSKGIALGDSASTVLHVYGKPILQEEGKSGCPVVWYYIDDAQPGVYLAFVISADKKEIIDIVLTDARLPVSADCDVRYGLKENGNEGKTR